MGNSNGGCKGSYWVLDPIDGTRGFVGMRQYAVCLGLIKDGEVIELKGGFSNRLSIVIFPQLCTSHCTQ